MYSKDSYLPFKNKMVLHLSRLLQGLIEIIAVVKDFTLTQLSPFEKGC